MVTLMPHSPAVSVVVPLYNKEQHVFRAIDGILKQTFQDFEVVVVDDGSTDGGAAVVRAMGDPRIRLISQPNAGVSVARNNGIAVARAPLIAFCDADDAWRPDFLANIVDLQREFPQAGAYALNYECVGADGTRSVGVAHSRAPRLLLDPAGFFEIAKFGTPVFSSSVAVVKDSFAKAGNFPPGVKLGEDLDTWIRICFVAPIAFDVRPGGIYYQDAQHRAVVQNPPPERYVFFDTIDRWVGEQRDLPSRLLDDIREFKNAFVLVYARHQIRFGSPHEGRRALLTCRTRDFLAQKWKWLLASFLPQGLQGAMAGVKAAVRSS